MLFQALAGLVYPSTCAHTAQGKAIRLFSLLLSVLAPTEVTPNERKSSPTLERRDAMRVLFRPRERKRRLRREQGETYRERERERESILMWVYMYMFVCVWMGGGRREKE